MTAFDTIAAISTAPGRAGIAIVRVSGDNALGIAEKLSGFPPPPGKISKAKILGEDCVLLAFANPRSFTGEDTIEIQCHGGAIAPRRILEKCFELGARSAGRGEFTRRAFLNGKITLEEAHGILELIDARTERAAIAAIQGLENKHTARLKEIYEAIIDISTNLEHALDIDDGELTEDFLNLVTAKTSSAIDLAKREIRSLKEGKILREGALVVLAGPPNAGKSSLMNALLGENRAIVSSIAGTTRDSIEEWIDINGWPIRLVDTAGLRKTRDEIESEGVDRAATLARKADICLLVSSFDTAEPRESAREILNLGKETRVIEVATKCDLMPSPSAINISSLTRQGLEELKAAIAYTLEEIASSDQEREIFCEEDKFEKIAPLKLALSALEESLIAPDMTIAANQVRRASAIVGNLLGAEYSQDLLDRIFSRFCVGK